MNRKIKWNHITMIWNKYAIYTHNLCEKINAHGVSNEAHVHCRLGDLYDRDVLSL